MIVRLQLNEKKSMESQTELMGWYWNRKPTWRKDMITYNSHPWIVFSFNRLVLFGEGEFVWSWTSKVKWVEESGRRWTRKGGEVMKIGQFSWTSYVYHPYSKLTKKIRERFKWRYSIIVSFHSFMIEVFLYRNQFIDLLYRSMDWF